ncbi:nucleotide-diphospho-sugar transferase [Sistotremastrum niveocremeum HHB9708]|uniref:dolichyl-phosphate beta-glucosyltransferase n=1 Tax=Sistotremastrum niveocremeum HHB9708 TaxID=1314777 RepID=A0A164W2X9_9AGAM|nr:nucleotide-diphospho-sugar transferase [Sistotremastrum niveocremeum HHB9708]
MLDDALNHLQAPSTPKRSVEFIVVDDGSQDKTTAVALELASQHKNTDLRVIRLTKNRGKGGAVQAGVLGSRGRRILMVDADGASRFGDLEQLWDEMSKLEVSPETAVVSIGSRAHLVGTEAVVKRSAVRNFLMHGFHVTLRTLGVGHIRDTQCGFKLFNRPAALALFRPLHLQSWLFDVELLILAQYQNIPVAEVPVGWHEVAGSKLRLISDSIGMLTDLLVLRANYALGRWSIDDGKNA